MIDDCHNVSVSERRVSLARPLCSTTRVEYLAMVSDRRSCLTQGFGMGQAVSLPRLPRPALEVHHHSACSPPHGSLEVRMSVTSLLGCGGREMALARAADQTHPAQRGRMTGGLYGGKSLAEARHGYGVVGVKPIWHCSSLTGSADSPRSVGARSLPSDPRSSDS